MATTFLSRVQFAWTTRPWLHWVAAYAIPMGFYSAFKLAALPAVVGMYADLSERSLATALSGMVLAWCEDFAATTLLLATLYALEAAGRALEHFALRGYGSACNALLDVISVLVHVYVVFVATALWFAPFAADMLLVRTTHIRFSTELLVAYVRESAMASNLPVSERERQLAVQIVVATVASTFAFTVVYSVWIDLSLWSPTSLLARAPSFSNAKALVQPATSVPLASQQAEKDIGSSSDALAVVPHKGAARSVGSNRTWAMLAVAFVLFTVATRIAAGYLAGPTLGAIALNATLDQLSRVFLRSEFQPSAAKAELAQAADYIHSDTEQYSLFQADSLFRRTTGFKGPLAFDVDVDQDNLPNVLVIAVESFRASDSKYLAEAVAVDAALKTQRSVRLTPQFDRWARRNVAFSNMWSSWQTSRSLESILFGQVPLDSVADSGTTGGRADVALVGMPQFFKQKGYETAFSTGTRTDYDQWNKFLPAHGFDTVLDVGTYQKLAETHLGVRPSDWQGEARRGFPWGIHDDLSFEILNVLIETKMKKQEESIRRGVPRHPFFMTHYTISSHGPWEDSPKWFDGVELPDFASLCDGQLQCARIQRYAKLRYFTDMMLGKFLDSLEAKGLLQNMIVVVTGDHGQNPEHDENVPRSEEVDKTHVAGALIAEGRLGKYAGTVIKDAVEHYDLLNTLADIVGVPDEGFLQTSVGRSLKRDAGYGERLVWSNNPMNKMSVVRGRQRFVYDRLSNAMTLHDTATDPYEQQDLLPTQSEAQLAEWLAVRTAGRMLNNYFKDRWAGKCLAQAECHTKKHHGHA